MNTNTPAMILGSGSVGDVRQSIESIRNALINLRLRTGCKQYSVGISKGKGQVQWIEFDADGNSTVKPMSDWVPVSELAALLQGWPRGVR